MGGIKNIEILSTFNYVTELSEQMYLLVPFHIT